MEGVGAASRVSHASVHSPRVSHILCSGLFRKFYVSIFVRVFSVERSALIRVRLGMISLWRLPVGLLVAC